ncbi:prepilin-type N-terminal cleavage/methylation domain-containing protein [Duganella sp. FT135W]|uniref:Prepilin-type N-terminal cleavage/methylation domain-containing protein n=1 Tax=Duganella flavida TaxID=2692175 RepID=A0A6L8KHB1_9BURK|nr:type II secretion system protein [Duganella flavida]MYM26127.1 prepilin-type N-terminal cleavage/methylation domain-containing protein [Duganella flavida]
MKSARTLALRQRGFTLVEAIIVMVVTGVLAGVMVLFIRQPIQNYVDASARADLSDTADLALRRMARELRGALPNSIRTLYSGGVWYVQFIPVKAAGQYLAVEDNASSGIPLSFTSNTATQFDVVGPMPAINTATDLIAIYNLGNGITDADAYFAGESPVTVNQLNRQGVVTVSGTTVTLANSHNNFADPAVQGRVPNSSPDHRFFVINTPVTFRCEGKADGTGTLARISNNPFSAVQATVAFTSNTPLLATNVQECDFSATQAGSLHSALIGMTLSLARPRAGVSANGLETVTLVHQIHMDNTP